VANPAMVPPPPQMPSPRPPRSIAGAIVLIILGTLFLLGTMGILNSHGLVILFGRFWPALLILWGVIKLIEYEQAKRAGMPGRGIGVGGAFLMIFLIVAGLIATGASRLDWGGIKEHLQIDDSDIGEFFGGESFDYNGDLSADLPLGAAALEINDDRGTITINVADDKEKKVRVAWRKKLHAENQKDADNYNAKTQVTMTPGGKGIVLNANTQAAGEKGVSTDMDIYVPRNLQLIITARRGDVDINGMGGGAQINHQRGEVNINDLTGNAALTLEHSSARIEHVKGDVTIQGRTNEVDVEDISGSVQLNGEFQESVRLVQVTRTVGFHSSRTDMEFARLDGRLDLDSGDLRADSLFGPMRLNTRSKDIALEGLSGDLRLQDENGSVDVGLYKPGNIQIDNRKGDVQVAIPPNTAIKVEARTRQGEIETDFDEIKVDNHENQSTASGSIGTNGPRLAINCDKGTIEIRKGSIQAAPAHPATPPTPARPGTPQPPPKPPVESEN
jgi:DUF4097 and DUF4098 domain-containing protein YvlB